jgi:hypothetical protein
MKKNNPLGPLTDIAGELLGYNATIIGLKIRNNTQAPVTERPVALPPEGMGGASIAPRAQQGNSRVLPSCR